MAATVTALTMALRRMQQRDAVGYQRWLRARVLAQGVTVAAFVFAGVQEYGAGVLTGAGPAASSSSSPTDPNTPAPAPGSSSADPRDPAGLRGPRRSAQEAREFARRLRAAEEAHAADEAMRSGESPAGSGGIETGYGAEVKTHEPRRPEKGHEGGGWLSWIGLGKSK